MPDEKGLYWARRGEYWYLVDYQQAKHAFGSYTMDTYHRNRHGFERAGSLLPEEIDEWGARVVEPGEG